jgi:hypothetical protein
MPVLSHATALADLQGAAGEEAVGQASQVSAVKAAPVQTSAQASGYSYQGTYYQGTLNMDGGKKINVCFVNSGVYREYDENKNLITKYCDPDMPGSGCQAPKAAYASEPIQKFFEDGQECTSSKEIDRKSNMGSFRTCSGLSMVEDEYFSWRGGVVMSGSNKVGTFKELEIVDSCGVEAAKTPAPVQSAEKLQYYQGTMTINGEPQAVCFGLSLKKINRYEGDVDVSPQIYQEIPILREGDKVCSSSLYFDGEVIFPCSRGYYLVGDGSPSSGVPYTTLERGSIFNQLDRFDPETGGLAVQPVGSYTLARADSCK